MAKKSKELKEEDVKLKGARIKVVARMMKSGTIVSTITRAEDVTNDEIEQMREHILLNLNNSLLTLIMPPLSKSKKEWSYEVCGNTGLYFLGIATWARTIIDRGA